jgi:hypothetical protein
MKLTVFLNGLRLLRTHQMELIVFGLNPGVAMLLCFSKIVLNILEKRLTDVEKL